MPRQRLHLTPPSPLRALCSDSLSCAVLGEAFFSDMSAHAEVPKVEDVLKVVSTLAARVSELEKGTPTAGKFFRRGFLRTCAGDGGL